MTRRPTVLLILVAGLVFGMALALLKHCRLQVLTGAELRLQRLIPPNNELKSRPVFAEFPVRQIYRGAPATPKLHIDHRLFRTMIRRGAKAEVGFAGHYTVPQWGCGTGCTQFAVVDAITGAVYYGPFSVKELPLEWLELHEAAPYDRMEFYPDSQLMKINGCPNERDCGFYDYVMVDGKGLRLIRQELLRKQHRQE